MRVVCKGFVRMVCKEADVLYQVELFVKVGVVCNRQSGL